MIQVAKIKNYNSEVKFEFQKEVSVEDFEKIKELSESLDLYFEFIDDGVQYRNARFHNRIICDNLEAMGCLYIEIPNFISKDNTYILKTAEFCR